MSKVFGYYCAINYNYKKNLSETLIEMHANNVEYEYFQIYS